jgi:hypothetical protein
MTRSSFSLRTFGSRYDVRKTRVRLVSCRGRSQVSLACRYIGADDTAGPNYTEQPAVNSYYKVVGN